MSATVTRLADRRPIHVVTVQSQALCEAGVEVSVTAARLADLLSRLSEANRDKRAFVRSLEAYRSDIRDLAETGRWLRAQAEPPRGKAA